MLPSGQGEAIADLGATLKAPMGPETSMSSFEVVIGPGFDVGAHLHTRGEEVFFILEGEIDLLALEPADRSVDDWHEWVSASGRRFLRGGPGAFMHVPLACRTPSPTGAARRCACSSSRRCLVGTSAIIQALGPAAVHTARDRFLAYLINPATLAFSTVFTVTGIVPPSVAEQ